MEDMNPSSIYIFLGAGGQEPRVDIIDTDSLETSGSARFESMHSAYALDADWDGERFLAGTKGGLIHVFADFKDSANLLPFRIFVQGAPVLSISYMGQSKFAVSDVAGRCLLWQEEGEDIPIPLETRGETICTLLALSENRLAGLSCEGTFFSWNVSEAKLLHERHVSAPPPMGGLVRMVFWHAAHVIAFPGANGNLVLYDPKEKIKRELQAHDGSFYALCPFGAFLVTVGMEDRLLKVWAPDCERPLREVSVPGAVLSVSNLGGTKQRFLLISSEGTAQIYFLDKEDLVLDRCLTGSDYRISLSPPPQIMQARETWKREQEAYELCTRLENTARSDQQAPEMHLSRLKEIGYGHVALAIQAEKMEEQGDLAECIRLRSALVKILPEHPAACPSFERYAACLDKSWLLTEAECICQKILRIDPNYHTRSDFARILSISGLLRTDRCVIEPDVDLRNIVVAANALGQKFLGCYLLRKLSRLHCNHTSLDAETIAQKWLEAQGAPHPFRSITVQPEKIWWISRSQTQEIDLVMFVKEFFDDIEGPRFALQVLPYPLGTVIVPVILFDWRDDHSASTTEQSNTRALKALVDLRNDTVPSQVREIHRQVTHVLRRLITKNSKQKETSNAYRDPTSK